MDTNGNLEDIMQEKGETTVLAKTEASDIGEDEGVVSEAMNAAVADLANMGANRPLEGVQLVQSEQSSDGPNSIFDTKGSEDKTPMDAANAIVADWANTDASLPDKKTQSALPEEQNDNLDSVAKSEESKEILVGETCEMKDLYASGKSICKCCISWEDKKPWNDNSTQARKVRDERDAFAIIRRQFPYESDMWETASIDINSAHIKLALSKVLEGYLNVKPKAPSLSFDRPFTPFCHRWERLVEVQENERDPKIREHLSLLRQTLEAELKESFCAMKDFQDTGYVTFERLPLFFVPGEVVLKSADGLVSAGVLRDVTKSETRSGKKYFEFKVMVVDWDGRKCGVLLQDWDLYEFQGPRLLRTLKISLLKIQPDHLTIQSNLVERGKKFEELRGQHIKFYKGLVPDDDDWLFYTSGTRPMCERIVVDPHGYYSLREDTPPNLWPLSRLNKPDSAR